MLDVRGRAAPADRAVSPPGLKRRHARGLPRRPSLRGPAGPQPVCRARTEVDATYTALEHPPLRLRLRLRRLRVMQQLDRDDTVSMCSEKHRGDADGIKSLENTSSHASTTS